MLTQHERRGLSSPCAMIVPLESILRKDPKEQNQLLPPPCPPSTQALRPAGRYAKVEEMPLPTFTARAVPWRALLTVMGLLLLKR